jgi:hypothetical protein
MMCPADIATTLPPVGRLHRFGSADFEGASSM